MKFEQSEKLFVEEAFLNSIKKKARKPLAAKEKKKISIEKLTGDASTRRYYRILRGNDYYVVCLDRPLRDGETYPFFEIQQCFYKNKIRVPEIYDYNFKKGYILEEDLGDVTLLRWLATAKGSQDELRIYKECIDILIKIHSIPTSKKTKTKKHFNAALRFDYEKLMAETEMTVNFFIKKTLKTKWNKKKKDSFMELFSPICKKLADGPMVLCHRDFHSRNLMLKNSRPVVIDFQDARLGMRQYDLVSLLEDCYYQLDPKNIETLKKYYWNKTKNSVASNKNYEKFCYYYDLMAIQRTFKAIGSFSYIYHSRKDKRYLKYISGSMEKIRKILNKYEDFYELKKELFSIYYAS